MPAKVEPLGKVRVHLAGAQRSKLIGHGFCS
jgi:hypothetical protein